MTLLTKSIRTLLIVLMFFLALAAFEGGIQLLVGFYTPPVEMLSGSIFKDFTLPGLALGIIVGGSALLTAILLLKKNRFSILASIATGVIIMFFEFVEMLAIGSPAGPARFMQIFFFGMGTVIIAASIGQLFLGLITENPDMRNLL